MYLSVNTSLPICPATNLQHYVEPLPNPSADLENAASAITQLAKYDMDYLTAFDATNSACNFPNEITTRNSDECFKSIPNLLEKTENMRTLLNTIQKQTGGTDHFQSHFLAEKRASQNFLAACSFSENSEAKLKTPAHCLKSLTSYIDQTQKTIDAESEMTPNEDAYALKAMQNFGGVLKGYQHIFRVLLKIRGNA